MSLIVDVDSVTCVAFFGPAEACENGVCGDMRLRDERPIQQRAGSDDPAKGRPPTNCRRGALPLALCIHVSLGVVPGRRRAIDSMKMATHSPHILALAARGAKHRYDELHAELASQKAAKK